MNQQEKQFHSARYQQYCYSSYDARLKEQVFAGVWMVEVSPKTGTIH